MFKRGLIIISLLPILLGCSTLSGLKTDMSKGFSKFTHKPACYTPKTQTIMNRTPKFTQIKASGKMNLRVQTHSRGTWVRLYGDSRDLCQVKWLVQHNTLTIHSENSDQHAPVDVVVNTPQLSSLSFDGQGTLTAKHIRSKQLDLSIHNKGFSTIEGNMNLRHVDLSGWGKIEIKSRSNHAMNLFLSGSVQAKIVGLTNLKTLHMSDKSYVSLYWIKSQTLQVIMTDNARAQMAGIAHVAYINMDKNSNLNARYLRATEAFVKTHDDALAKIAVVRTQHTLAKDQSNIYYFNPATYETNFMAQNGAVLDLIPKDNES